MCNKVYLDGVLVKPVVTGKNEKKVLPPKVKPDILALSTIYTRLLLKKFSALLDTVKATTFYRILTRTTQPAHLAVVVAVLCLSIAIYPARDGSQSKNSVYQFAYVTATAVHFGSQIWMTFISGLSLYFSLPRHDFGEVQKVLFPIYFTWSAMLSLIAVFAQARWAGLSMTTSLLAIRFILEIAVRARCCSPLVNLISRKNAIEASHGLGREVGKLAADSTLFEQNKYLSLHHQFRRLHMIIALANMASIGISTIHIWLTLQSCHQCL